jgi:beta-lactamase superfamily II metal-dependent hydrolase
MTPFTISEIEKIEWLMLSNPEDDHGGLFNSIKQKLEEATDEALGN